MTEEQPSQEVFDAAMAGWKADPAAMRNKILDTATDIASLITAMSVATHEQAAYGAFTRGEKSVVIGDPEHCLKCEEALVSQLKATPSMKFLKVMRTPVWMGPQVRWVCEICMARMPQITYSPNFKDIDNVSNN